MPILSDRRGPLPVILLLAASCAGLAGQNLPPAQTGADDALLAKAASLYYSTAKAGLSGFDCAVHPDWRGLFLAQRPDGALSSDDRSEITLLNGVRITVHARLAGGGSTLDWVPSGNGGDADSAGLLDRMHTATEQTLMGFLQFWTPFMNGSIIPASTAGITATHTPSTFNLHSQQADTTVDETFSSDLLLTEYDVTSGGTSIKFQPGYKATPQGLLVERFQAHMQEMADPPAPAQDIHVGIEYQTLEGLPIPQRLDMEIVGEGVFNFTLDGCTLNRQTKRE